MNRRGNFAIGLIGLVIVIAIIAILVSKSVPTQVAEKRYAMLTIVATNLKIFSTAMTMHQQITPGSLYPEANGTAPATTYYSHLSPKEGYIYEYYVNDARKKYCYIAYPTNLSSGNKIFVIDESTSVWEAVITAVPTGSPSVNMDAASSMTPNQYSRIYGFPGVAPASLVWIRQS